MKTKDQMLLDVFEDVFRNPPPDMPPEEIFKWAVEEIQHVKRLRQVEKETQGWLSTEEERLLGP